MSRMTRRTIPSRKVRPFTRVSRLAPVSIVVLINMTDEYFVGAKTRGVYPRALARQFFWSFPVGTFIAYPRAARWSDPRSRGL